MLKVISVGSIFLLLGLSQTSFAADAGWSCTKDGKAIEVKGDTPNDKKKTCEAAKGKWNKDKPKKESASGGGGW